jgi:hypothetical protein
VALLVHPTTKLLLDSLVAARPHALMLHGPNGIGLDTIGLTVAAGIAGERGAVEEVVPDKTGITIEQVRELYVRTRSKQANRRVIVLRGADTMAIPAQNAFLKLLEEPTASLTFILLAHKPQQLAATIHSRVQSVELLPISAKDSQQALESYALEPSVAGQILFIASGLPAEIIRLASDEKYRDVQIALASDAKKLISSTKFEKLLLVQKLAADRDNCLHTLRIAARMLTFQIARSPRRDLVVLLDRLESTASRIASNGNLRAQLLRLVAA